MSQLSKNLIGKKALLLVLMEDDAGPAFIEAQRDPAFKICVGRVGSMDPQKIVVAVETAAKRSGLINDDIYRESHALYHAIIEALHGVTRGQLELGTILRTVGLRFSVVRGNPYQEAAEGEWIAVALYGTVGAPIKGSEHETVGMGISHI